MAALQLGAQDLNLVRVNYATQKSLKKKTGKAELESPVLPVDLIHQSFRAVTRAQKDFILLTDP